MKIQKLSLDEKDIKEAVEFFLKQRGITMPVHSITKEYSWSKEYVVTFEFEVEKSEPIPPAQEPLPEPLPEKFVNIAAETAVASE